jgi:hypothetical protein
VGVLVHFVLSVVICVLSALHVLVLFNLLLPMGTSYLACVFFILILYGKFRSRVLVLLLSIGVVVLDFGAIYGFSCQGVIFSPPFAHPPTFWSP